jgi:hypothetical protein
VGVCQLSVGKQIGWSGFLGGVLFVLLNFDEPAYAVPDVDCLLGDLVELLIDYCVLILFFCQQVALSYKLKIELLQVVLHNKQLIFKSFLFQVAFLH